MLAYAHCAAAVAAVAFELVAGLAAALCSLLPHVALLPLTVPALNSKRWYPQQCPATGRLFRGALQLTSGTLLLLDETGMGAGQLGDAGVKNLQVGSSTLPRAAAAWNMYLKGLVGPVAWRTRTVLARQAAGSGTA